MADVGQTQTAPPPRTMDEAFRRGIMVTRRHPTISGAQVEADADGKVLKSWRTDVYGQVIPGTERDGAEPGDYPADYFDDLPGAGKRETAPAPPEGEKPPAQDAEDVEKAAAEAAKQAAAPVDDTDDPVPPPEDDKTPETLADQARADGKRAAPKRANPKAEEPAQDAQPEAPDEVDPALARARAESVAPAPPAPPLATPFEAAGEIDYSDAPDFTDPNLYPDDEAANRAQRAYYTRKANEHAAAQQRAQQEAYERQAQQAQAAEQERRGAGMMARTKTLTGMDDAAFEARRMEIAGIAHPQPRNPQGPPNPVQVALVNARDQALGQRAASGLGVDRHEGIPEIVAEQMKDPAYARALAAGFPDIIESGLLLTAVAEIAPMVTPVLRHLIGTPDGREIVRRTTREVLDQRPGRADPGTVGVLMNNARMEVAQLVARMGAAPARQQPAAQPAAREAEPTRAQAIPVPGASTPAPAGGSEPRIGSPEWQTMVVERAKKEAAARGRGWQGVRAGV